MLVAAALAVAPACSSSNNSSSGGSSPSSAPAGSQSGGTKITTKLLKFEPDKLTVPQGTTVTWSVPDSLVHTVTTGTFTIGSDGLRTSENPDGIINQPLKKGQDVTYKFDKPGTYTYYCSIHKGMRGEITVTP